MPLFVRAEVHCLNCYVKDNFGRNKLFGKTDIIFGRNRTKMISGGALLPTSGIVTRSGKISRSIGIGIVLCPYWGPSCCHVEAKCQKSSILTNSKKTCLLVLASGEPCIQWTIIAGGFINHVRGTVVRGFCVEIKLRPRR